MYNRAFLLCFLYVNKFIPLKFIISLQRKKEKDKIFDKFIWMISVKIVYLATFQWIF